MSFKRTWSSEGDGCCHRLAARSGFPCRVFVNVNAELSSVASTYSSYVLDNENVRFKIIENNTESHSRASILRIIETGKTRREAQPEHINSRFLKSQSYRREDIGTH